MILEIGQLQFPKAATICNPLRLIEFDDLIYGRSKRSTPRIDNSSTASLPFVQNINYPSCIHSPKSNSSLSVKSNVISTSPVRGIKPQEYTNNGLKIFLNYCSDLYGDDSYADFFDIFRTNHVGVDTFKYAQTDQIARKEVIAELEKLHVTPFAARRIINTYTTWHDEIPGSTS